MARISPVRHSASTRAFRVSSELLGRTKLQQISTNPTPPPSVPRPTVRRSQLPHKASIRDYIR